MTAAAACENHPEREAIGVCVQCRTRVCGACVTKVEGINHCVSCLETLAAEGARAVPTSRQQASAVAPYLAAMAYLVLLCVAVWSTLAVLLPGGA